MVFLLLAGLQAPLVIIINQRKAVNEKKNKNISDNIQTINKSKIHMKTVLNMASLGLSSPTWRLGQDSYTSLSLPKNFNFSPIQLVVVFSTIYYYVLHNHHLQMLIIVIVILDLYIVQAQKWGGGEGMGEREIEVFMGGKNPTITSITLVLCISMPRK